MNISQILANPVSVEPGNLVKGSPELGSLVDVDLASLLSICLAELLAVAQAGESSLKDASLACEIGCAIKSQVAGKHDLVGVKKRDEWVTRQVNRLALPVHLEAVGASRQGAEGRTVVGERLEVLVLTVGSNNPSRWLRRGTNTAGSSGSHRSRVRVGAVVRVLVLHLTLDLVLVRVGFGAGFGVGAGPGVGTNRPWG